MKSRILKWNNLSVVMLMFMFFFSLGCGEDENKDNEVITDDTTKTDIKTQIKISMPAPSDIASILIDDPSLKFNPDIINPISNADNYSTDKSIAVNLGIYTADLTYASFFGEKEISKKYYSITKQMAEKLNIIHSVGEKHMKMISEKKLTKEMMVKIINESFLETDAYLLQNERQDVMTMILFGGWLEAEYIAMSLTNGKFDANPELTQRIVDQSFSVDLMSMIFENISDDENLKQLKPDVDKIKLVYDKLVAEVNQQNFEELYKLIKEIREKYVV